MRRISVVERSGSHLLIERAGRFAVVERRNGRIYGLDPEARQGFPETPEGLTAAAGPGGWQDEAEARRRFAELRQAGERLARRLW